MVDDVEKKLLEVVRKYKPSDNNKSSLGDRFSRDGKTLGLDTKISELGLDSLDALNLLMDIEDDLDVNIMDERAAQWKTLRDAYVSISEYGK